MPRIDPATSTNTTAHRTLFQRVNREIANTAPGDFVRKEPGYAAIGGLGGAATVAGAVKANSQAVVKALEVSVVPVTGAGALAYSGLMAQDAFASDFPKTDMASHARAMGKVLAAGTMAVGTLEGAGKLYGARALQTAAEHGALPATGVGLAAIGVKQVAQTVLRPADPPGENGGDASSERLDHDLVDAAKVGEGATVAEAGAELAGRGAKLDFLRPFLDGPRTAATISYTIGAAGLAATIRDARENGLADWHFLAAGASVSVPGFIHAVNRMDAADTSAASDAAFVSTLKHESLPLAGLAATAYGGFKGLHAYRQFHGGNFDRGVADSYAAGLSSAAGLAALSKSVGMAWPDTVFRFVGKDPLLAVGLAVLPAAVAGVYHYAHARTPAVRTHAPH